MKNETIFYNWKTVLRHSKKSAKDIVLIVDYITFRPIPNHVRDKEWVYSQVDWSGDSFLINPKALLRHRYGKPDSVLDIAHYIALASLRSYPEYKTVGKLSLDLLACEGKEDIINNNSLLYIKNNEVHFIYEEANKE